LAPIAAHALGENTNTAMAELVQEFNRRAAKSGLTV
jgi:hypothetical protein